MRNFILEFITQLYYEKKMIIIQAHSHLHYIIELLMFIIL